MSTTGRAAVTLVVFAATTTATANAQRDCVRIAGVAEVRPRGEVKRNEGAAGGVQLRSVDRTAAPAVRDVFSSVSRLSIVPRFIVHVSVACKEQKGRLTLAPLFVAKDGALVTWPMTDRAADSSASVLYAMPVDSSNPNLRNLSIPGGGALLVEWLGGPIVIVLERLGIRLRVTHTRFLVIVPLDGREAYVLLESGSIEVIGSSVTLTEGKLWRIGAGTALPRIEEMASDPSASKQLSDAAHFDEGLVNVSRPFFKNPAGLAAVGAVGAFVVLQLMRRDCGGSCAVVLTIPIP